MAEHHECIQTLRLPCKSVKLIFLLFFLRFLPDLILSTCHTKHGETTNKLSSVHSNIPDSLDGAKCDRD